MPAVKGWQAMRDRSAALLLARTGAGVETWTRRIQASRPADEPALRIWLSEQGVTGYAQALLVWEVFGYPDFLTTDASALIDGQYADRPHLRPVFDSIVAALPALGEVTVQARKTYVSLVSPRRTFAVVQATTKRRVDLGLRLDVEPRGRLRPAPNLGNGSMPVRLELSAPEEVDAAALDWLQMAYSRNI
jgi:uncharacterized protein DUF5655